MKLWAGRQDGKTSAVADAFNSSFAFDKRLFAQDIKGSMAHATMLAAKGIITETDRDSILGGLQDIYEDILSGNIDLEAAAAAEDFPEDIHMFIEQILTERIGDAGKRLHTARSRNDQVALDMRLYLIDIIPEIQEKISALGKEILNLAAQHKETIMPGYTHLQRAQPVTFAHYILAYAMMLSRDIDRLSDCVKRTAVSPIGCGALAGTTYDTDRYYEADLLGMESICLNSMDGVSDRDFSLELLSCLSILMMHLSRFSEEIILWSSWEFKFVELSDDFTTGSSMMPQKKNSDMAELVRGKCGRVYGDLMALLTTLKGLPLAYNKDMQEDKEGLFDAIDTVCMCLDVFAPMVGSMKVFPENMKAAASRGFINATDLADYIVGKGVPFRDAYKISGKLVSKCIADGCTLETLPLSVYNEMAPIFGEDVYEAIDLATCVAKRNGPGGPSPESVDAQIAYLEKIFE